ncbi:MAG: glycosyltransferase family 4 protein [Chloroflexi bacterium]|nr:glycosyltransferase family 4 protein [Chloroflexota bacterium]
MRIGMMADLYRPHISGVTNYIDLTREVLTSWGHEVFIFTFGEPQPDDDDYVIRSPGLPLRFASSGLYLNVRYTPEARRALQAMDIVHVHHPFLSGRLALRYAKPVNIPIVFTNHTRYDLYMRAYLPLVPEALGDMALRAYLPRFCREIDLTIAPSRGVLKMLRDLGVDADIRVIPNGVDLTAFTQPVQPVAREQWGIGPEHVVVMYVGRLGPEKNLPFLLRAFWGMAQVYPQAHLVLVGDGPERENLQDRVQHMRLTDRVHFAGMVPYEDVPRYLAAADIFATASDTEVHPLSVIEAMASGLPVVGVRSPGVGEVVEHNRTGLLVEKDVAAFASALGRLVGDGALRRRLGEQARQAASAFDIRHTTRALVSEYERLIRQHRQHQVPWWRRWWTRWWHSEDVPLLF